ncbi:hypothetical protein ACOZ4L_16705 (plasmid) [Haloplanus ruber]|uniref:DUF11 domain-containing protein n=1 Tax=Haloplanus ruber TaxID=869892 RepID=A0ABD6D1X0_9EURY|nr:hypothetical protein [Haloplanus ruber]
MFLYRSTAVSVAVFTLVMITSAPVMGAAPMMVADTTENSAAERMEHPDKFSWSEIQPTNGPTDRLRSARVATFGQTDGSDVSIAANSSGTDGGLDVGIELQQEATVSQDGSVDIETYPDNRANQSVSGTLELVIDQNRDNIFNTNETVASRQISLSADEYSTKVLTYSDVQLASGDYEYQARLSSDGQTVTSFTNGTLTVTGNDTSDGNDGNQSETAEFLSASQSEATLAPGEEITLSYRVQNPLEKPTSMLIEFPNLPANVSIQSVDGDVAQELLGSTPPGVVTSELAADGSATVDLTLTVPENATTGQKTVTTDATASSNQGTLTNTTTTTLTVTEQDPLVNRFGGSDNEIGNLDILRAVNAANTNQEVGGEPVSNLDVLELINRANQ